MVVDVLCDDLWCNYLVRLPSKINIDYISVLEALKNGGNELGALRDKHLVDRPPAKLFVLSACTRAA